MINILKMVKRTRKKIILRGSVSVAAVLLSSSTLFGLAPEDCLFYAPFDGTPDALISKGSPEAEIEGQTRFIRGIRGKAIIVGNYDNNDYPPVSFQSADNINGPSGSIAFWGKVIRLPYEYKSGGLGRTFLRANTDKGGVTFADHIAHTGLTFYGAGGYARTAIWVHWRADHWNHIVLTWTPFEHRLYVGGKLESSTTENIFPVGEFRDKITLGQAGKSAVAFDDFYIFRRPLTPEEVKILYDMGRGQTPYEDGLRGAINPSVLEGARNKPSETILKISKTETPPEIDGLLAEEVWNRSAQIGALTDELTGTLMQGETTFVFTYDREHLYIGARYLIDPIYRETPALFPAGPLKRSVADTDAGVWVDDNFAVTAACAKGVPHTFYISAAGVTRDERDGNNLWQSGFEARSFDDDNVWSAEFKIPFASLGIEPEEGASLGINISHTLRFIRDTRGTWYTGQHGDGMAKLILAGTGPVARFVSVGDLDNGDISKTIEVVNGTGEDAELSAILSINGTEAETTLLSLDPGERKILALRRELGKNASGRAEISLRHGEEEIYASQSPFNFGPALEISRRYFPSQDKLRIEINHSAIAWEDISAKINFYPEGSKEPIIRKDVETLSPFMEEILIDTSRVEPGIYDINVTLSDGTQVSEQKIVFEKWEKQWWEGSTAGIPERVPPPFTPVETSGMQVSVWGRRYDYEDSLFARQWTTQNRELFARPVSLNIVREGELLSLYRADSRIVKSSELEADILAHAESDSFSLTVKTRVEFDGFTWIDMVLDPSSPMDLDKMYLEIPMVKELATLMYTGSYAGHNVGFIPDDGYTGNHINGHWIGWAAGGIQLSSEHTHSWLNKNNVLGEIAKLSDATVYRLHFIDHPVTLSRPLEISFGLQATPTRPRPADWRTWDIMYNKGKEGRRGIALWNDRWSTGINYPVLAEESLDEYRFINNLGQFSKEGWIRDAGSTYRTWEQVRELKKTENITSLMYSNGGVTWAYSPEYQYYLEEWRPVPSRRFTLKPGGEKDWWAYTPVCINSTFQDFYMANLEQAVAREDVKGLYFDVWRSPSCENETHNCGYTGSEDGRLAHEPLLAQREFYKRVYTIMKEHNPDSIIAIHMSGQPWMALCSFADLMATGEQHATGLARLVSQGKEGNYYDILSFDKTQAEFMGHNWGPVSTILTEFSDAEPNASYPSRSNPFGALYFRDERLTEIYHVAGTMLIHDQILPWAFKCNTKPFERTRAEFETLGLDETIEYVPYWDNSQYAGLFIGGDSPDSEYLQVNSGDLYAGEDIVCAIYKKPERAMFVVMNNSDEDLEHVMLDIDFEQLGFKPENKRWMTDALTGAMYGYRGIEEEGEYRVIFPVKARSFRMLTTY